MTRPNLSRLKKAVIPLLLISSVLLCSKTVFQNKTPLTDAQLQTPLPTTELFLGPKHIPTFSYLSARPCRDRQTTKTVLVIVHSSPTHVLHRKAIRSTWASSTSYPNSTLIRTVFVVGRSAMSKIQNRVELEAAEHGDIVMVNILDTYRNLTEKHLAGLKWMVKNCPGVSYVLKVDDDAFVNMKRAAKVIESAYLSNEIIACRVVPDGSSPRRSGKWTVTQMEYPHQDYPEYCSGLAYFARPGALKKVYEAALSGSVPYLWIDDVYVTGLAAQVAGVRRLDIGVWYARTEQDVIRWLKNYDLKRSLPWIVSEMSPKYWPVDAIALWEKMTAVEKNVLT